MQCNGTETDFSQCPKELGNVTCQSGMYATAVCTDNSPPVEGKGLHATLYIGTHLNLVRQLQPSTIIVLFCHNLST